MFVKVERKYSPWAGNYQVSRPEQFTKYCHEENSKETGRSDLLIAANAAESSSNMKTIRLKATEDFVKNTFSRLWGKSKIAGG